MHIGYIGDRRVWYEKNNMEHDFIYTGSTQYWIVSDILDKHNNYDFWKICWRAMRFSKNICSISQ